MKIKLNITNEIRMTDRTITNYENENNNDIEKYFNKTKLTKFNLSNHKISHNINKIIDENEKIYYNLKQIKVFLFQNESNYNVLKQNLTNKTDLNIYLNEQEILLNFVKNTFSLNTYQAELGKIHRIHSKLEKIQRNLNTKNEVENILVQPFSEQLKGEDTTSSNKRKVIECLVNKNESRQENLNTKQKDGKKYFNYFRNNAYETRNEMFVAELKNVLKSRNIKSNIN